MTLTGTIFNKTRGESTDSATIAVKIGTQWQEPVAVNSDGTFQLAGLPGDSELQLLVESPDNEFVKRLIIVETKELLQSSSLYQDLGYLEVSEGVTYTFSVLDYSTGEPVEGLMFKACSYFYKYQFSYSQRESCVPEGGRHSEYFHLSSYSKNR